MTVSAADDTRDAELRALERAMGAVVVDSSQDWGGEIADDDDDDSDREAVVYGDDALFDDDDPLPPQGEAAALAEPTDLTGLLGDGAAESSSAFIAYLEQMAAGLEAQVTTPWRASCSSAAPIHWRKMKRANAEFANYTYDVRRGF